MAEPKSSRRSETALAGLRQYGNDRQIETLAIVRKAIAALRLGGARVTLGSIAEATKPFTPTGRGLAESTILRNPACRALDRKSVVEGQGVYVRLALGGGRVIKNKKK